MNKAVVTGGAGFIGSHLAESLANQGYHVVILDDLSTGKIENIEALLDKGIIEFIKGDIRDFALLHEVFRDTQYVFHQAALASVPRSIENPMSTHEVNITGTLNVLLAARDNDVSKIIYASSSSVYGTTDTLPQRENMIPYPLSPYAVSKLTGEYYCQVFNEIYGLSSVSLRYFNVYGPRQNPYSQYAAVIPIFIKCVLEGRSPIIFGDGNQTRDFTFVEDVVRANIICAESDAVGIFNIGGGEQTTINDVLKMVLKLANRDLEPNYHEPRVGDVEHTLADISKAKAIGYEPEYNLQDGLQKTVTSFRYEEQP